MLPSESKGEEIFTHSQPMKICVEFLDEYIDLMTAKELFDLLVGRNLEINKRSVSFTMQYAGELALLLDGITRGHELSNYNIMFGLTKDKDTLSIELEYN